jgi:hypothetical protein
MLLGSGDARVELNVGLGTFPRIWNLLTMFTGEDGFGSYLTTSPGGKQIIHETM